MNNTNCYRITYRRSFKFPPATACIRYNSHLENLHVNSKVLTSVACEALVRTAADEIRIAVLGLQSELNKLICSN